MKRRKKGRNSLIRHFQIAIAHKVIVGLYKGVDTSELDNLAAETAAGMTTLHPDYAILAARIAISNLHKKTEKVTSPLPPSHLINSSFV